MSKVTHEQHASEMHLPMSHWQRLPRPDLLSRHGWLRWAIVLAVFLPLFLSVPIPYYQSKEVMCIQAPCPTKGWHFGEPLGKRWQNQVANTPTTPSTVMYETPLPIIEAQSSLSFNTNEVLLQAAQTLDTRIVWQTATPDTYETISDTEAEQPLLVPGESMTGTITIEDIDTFKDEFETTAILREQGWQGDARFVGSGGSGYIYGYSMKRAAEERILISSVRFLYEDGTSYNLEKPCTPCTINVFLFAGEVKK